MTEKSLISFDYAIKCLLRNKGDYDIVEGFISALLGTLGYEPVKITALLESESNKEEKALKRSVADLIVEDTNGTKYIVEIERSFSHFAHKSCFNTSRMIADTVKSSQNYKEIAKVFHISLLYAPLKAVTEPLYHAETLMHKVGQTHIDLRIKGYNNIFEYKNMYPEYLFISVPCFNDVIKSEIDEWLYVLKNSETKEDFKSPYMAKLKEKLSVFRMTIEEHQAYIDYLNEVNKAEDALDIVETRGFDKGKAEGEVKGESKKAIEIAKKMLAKGKDIKEIAEFTDLSESEIKKLQS